jgi:hypothetical protein
MLPGWPVDLGGQITASPVIYDIDQLGLPEVVVTSEVDSVFILRADGTYFPGWPQHAVINTNVGRTPSPIVVDIDQSSTPEIIVVANDGRIHVWDRDGNVQPGWENVLIGQTVLAAGCSEATPTVGDVDGDGLFELLVGAEDGKLYGFNHDGTELDGFPIQFEGEVRSSAAIGDFDEDGDVDISIAGWDQNVYVWDLPGTYHANRMPWPYFRLDLMNRGNPEPPVVIGIALDPVPGTPRTYALGMARPNPFNPRTDFDFDVPGGAGAWRTQVAIYDVTGRLVRMLVDDPLPAGRHRLSWDGRDQIGRTSASGLYFIRAAAPGFEATQKILLVK